MKALILIPAFNESQTIGSVINQLPKKLKGINRIDHLVVDDGSSDQTYVVAKRARAQVLKHAINRGAGAATRTGLQFARENNYDIVVSFDADGQHNPKDIEKLITPILKKRADLVIGSRLKNSHNMPRDRFLLNWAANIMTLLLYGVFSTDSQSGLRAFSKKSISSIEISSNRMEYSSEILLEAKKNSLKVLEVPVDALYTPYSKAKGQKNSNALPVALRIMAKFLK